jgi:hypothetical protein
MSEPTWELLGGGGVIGGPIDYVGDWVAGTPYVPGQIVRYNGVDYLAVNPSTGQTPPWQSSLSKVSFGTTLPSNPVDGQEAILVDSITSPTYQWRFRYNAQSTSSAKWEFIGGSPKIVASESRDTTTSNSYTGIANSPTFVIPYNGNYEVSYGCEAWVNTGNATAWIALYASATLPEPSTDSWVAGSIGGHVGRTALVNLAPGVSLTTVHRTDVGYTAYYEKRWISVRPIKVYVP